MSDLIERLRAMGAAQRPHIGDEAADEIERLRNRLEVRVLEVTILADEVAKLQAVVDVAKRSREVDEYGLLSIKKGWDLDKALAALEDDDE